MTSPSAPATFQRPDLGMAYEEFDVQAALAGMAALRVMPWTQVGLQTASFSKIPLEQLLDDGRDLKRAPGASYARSESSFEQDSYATEEYGAEEVLDDRERLIYGYTGVRFEQIAADRAVGALMRALEVDVASVLQDDTTYAAQFNDVTTEWSTAASATPRADVLAARERFRLRVGFYPNTIVMSAKVHSNLIQCDEILDTIKYGAFNDDLGRNYDPLMLDEQLLAKILKIPKVVIAGGGSVRNSARPGIAASVADIWDDEYVTLTHTADGDDLRQPTFGRVFSFEGMVIEQYRDESRRGDVLRARHDRDVKVIHSELLEGLGNITA